MSAKIFSIWSVILFIALALVISGCTPAGPGALLNGKKYLDRGDCAAAVAELKTATTLLATNPVAWNYYGVALQRTGRPEDAAAAYQTALRLNRDLMEAHFNLGSLWLEQAKPDAAKAEFMAYTLRRPNDAAGWLKLGSTQLKLGETVPAERSFSTVLALKQSEAEAYNGLGLARIQRGKPRDAAQFFAAATQARPDFAPAILNQATVNQQYLHDHKTALEYFQKYLALTPRPANWDEVKAIAGSLEQSLANAAAASAAALARSNPQPAVSATELKPQPKTSSATTSRPAVAPKPSTVVAASPANPPAAKPLPVQVVSVPPATPIVVKPDNHVVVASAPPVEAPLPEPAPEKKKSFWRSVFGSDKNTASAPNSQFLEKGLTPLPSGGEPPVVPVTRPAVVAAPAPVTFSRYRYVSPAKPVAGDRRSASGAFTKAQVFEQNEKWVDALQWYQQAAEIDPAWFEAQFNTGVLAHRLRNYSVALPRYELALASRPDAPDARYNFALALQAAGFVPDAANELKKLLVANPAEVRVNLALANLYAQSLHDTPAARQHYLKVLELDPENSHAADIRFWLAANPK